MSQQSSPIVNQSALLREDTKTINKICQLFFNVFGTLVEYYDYALYGFAAAAIAQHFFPDENGTISLIKTYGIFAVGSIAKPLGSLIFGIIGDRFGRRFALRWNMLGMIIPTAIIGLLPSYQEWGVFAALLLLCCRLAQGMFVAGESDGVRLVVYESFLKRYPCFGVTFVGISCYIGIFLASQTTTLCSSLIPESSWAWRIPFLIGSGFGILVLVMRQYLQESTDYVKAKKENPVPPTLLVGQYFRPLLATILLTGFVGGSYHLFFIFLVTFFGKLVPLASLSDLQQLSTNCLGIYIAFLFVGALLSDFTKPIRVVIFGFILVFVGIVQLMTEISQSQINPITWYGLSISMSVVQAPIFPMLFPYFHVLHRYRCISLGHSIGSMLLSGTAPFLATTFWHQWESPLAPLVHFFGLQILGLVGLGILWSHNRSENFGQEYYQTT